MVASPGSQAASLNWYWNLGGLGFLTDFSSPLHPSPKPPSFPPRDSTRPVGTGHRGTAPTWFQPSQRQGTQPGPFPGLPGMQFGKEEPKLGWEDCLQLTNPQREEWEEGEIGVKAKSWSLGVENPEKVSGSLEERTEGRRREVCAAGN